MPRVDGDRYWSVALLDIWTNDFAILGRRQDGGGPVVVVVVGPDFREPEPKGRVIRSPSNDAWLLGRFLVNGAEDATAVHRLQDGLRIGPLDTEAPLLPQKVPVTTSTDPANFLAVVNEFLVRNSVPANERTRYLEWRDLGIGDGPEAFVRTSPEVQEAWRRRLPVLHQGLKIGLLYGARMVDGWAVSSSRVGDHRGEESLRAAVALGGIGALTPDEALYLSLATDPHGAPLSGAKRWKLVVPPIEARGFWSLSMYEKDSDGRLFFTDNPIRRYSVGDRTPGLLRNADGSVELLLQPDAPADARNWLPTPAGAYALVLRIYLPSEPLRRGEAPLPRLVPAD